MSELSGGDKLGQEIERKFFVAQMPPDLESYPHQAITQGYLIFGEGGGEVRLRKSGQTCSLTAKGGGDLVRAEGQVPISPELFNELWPATAGRVLEKTRYQIPYQGFTIELDVYAGKLQGLVLAEVEFKSVEESAQFVPPPWFGREVTADRRYKARELVLR